MLKALFSSEARVKILALLIMNPSNQYYFREIIKLTGLPLQAAQRELAKLSGLGLLVRTTEGNRIYYRADPHHFLFPELKGLVIKTLGFGAELKDCLLKEDKIQAAFIYGSYAKDQETSKSDIDLFVVGTISGKDLAALIRKAAQTYGRMINPVLYSSAEFKSKKFSHFVATVIKGPKIFLKGDMNAL